MLKAINAFFYVHHKPLIKFYKHVAHGLNKLHKERRCELHYLIFLLIKNTPRIIYNFTELLEMRHTQNILNFI
jgi:hypothetical protein